jgi:hypothetical protein
LFNPLFLLLITMNSLKLLPLLFAVGVASAQTLTGVIAEPAVAKPGEPVKVTASFDNAENPNCNVKVHFGDGRSQMVRLNQPKDVPLVMSVSYDKVGDYRVQIEPTSNKAMLRCLGKKQFATVTVRADNATPELGSPKYDGTAKTVAGDEQPKPGCPQGWKLGKGGINAKTGAYTCTAKPNTPVGQVTCKGATSYFDNSAKGEIGCRL